MPPHLIYDDQQHSLADGETGRQLAIFNSKVNAAEAESIVGQLQPPADQPPAEHLLGAGVADSLPAKPSELIDAALEALDVVEFAENPWPGDIKIRMSAFQRAGLSSVTLGLAGCVMHWRLRSKLTHTYTPRDYCPSLERKLRFIHIIASGRIHQALAAMHIEPPEDTKHKLQIARKMPVPNYATDRDGFRDALEDIARELKRHSL